MKLALAILLLAGSAFAADVARCVKWERVRVTEYGLLPNGKLHITSQRRERRNAYLVGTNRMEIVCDDTDAAEKASIEKQHGKTVTLDKGKVKP